MLEWNYIVQQIWVSLCSKSSSILNFKPITIQYNFFKNNWHHTVTIRVKLLSIEHLAKKHLLSRATGILKDATHPAYKLFSLLPLGR